MYLYIILPLSRPLSRLLSPSPVFHALDISCSPCPSFELLFSSFNLLPHFGKYHSGHCGLTTVFSTILNCLCFVKEVDLNA